MPTQLALLADTTAGGELWTGSLLPVVQATLRVKRVPETPNYLHPLESVAKHNSAHCHNSNKITSSGPQFPHL